MSIAVISDVHANLEALNAVLRDAESKGAERIVCLGDIVGYNADPGACVQILQNRPDTICLMGNHDAMAAGIDSMDGINDMARQAMEWTRRQLSKEHLDWLRALDMKHREGDATFVHASLEKPAAWPYIRNSKSAEHCLDLLEDKVCFIGHTHHQGGWSRSDDRIVATNDALLDLKTAETWLINVGSVGQPRDGDSRAGYAIYDPGLASVALYRVAYDIEATRAKIMEAGLPANLAERLL